MFEKEIKYIADFNLNKIKSQGAFISFDKLAESDIHPAVVQYISAELDYLITEDRKKLLQQSVFDYSGTETAKYLNLISSELKKTKKIAFEDLKKLVIQAVSFNVNYLIRPRWSLSKLVFNEAEIKSAEEIKLTLNYIYYYDYFKDILKSYLAKRKLDALSITEFDLILKKIDKEIFSSDSQKLVDYFLYSLNEFLNSGSKSNTVPVLAAEIFLTEKNLKDYLFRLKKSFTDHTHQNSEPEKIREIIYADTPVEEESSLIEENDAKETIEDFIPTEKSPDIIAEEPPKENLIPENKEENLTEQQEIEFEPDKEEKETPSADSEQSNIGEEEFSFDASLDEDLLSLYGEGKEPEENQELEIEPEQEQTKFEEVKKNALDSIYDFEVETNQLLKEFSGEINIDEESKEKISSNIEQEPVEDETTGLVQDFLDGNGEENSERNEELDELTEAQFETTQAAKNHDKYLFDFISDKDIKKIISTVFNNDRDDFLSTVDKIGECQNYEEATEILKGVFLTYRINPYSKEAVALTNSVANFFNQI